MSSSDPDTTTSRAQSLSKSILSVLAADLGQAMCSAIIDIATGDNPTTIAIDDISTFALSIVRAALDVLEPDAVKAVVAAAWATADAQADALEDVKFPKGSD